MRMVSLRSISEPTEVRPLQLQAQARVLVSVTCSQAQVWASVGEVQAHALKVHVTVQMQLDVCWPYS